MLIFKPGIAYTATQGDTEDDETFSTVDALLDLVRREERITLCLRVGCISCIVYQYSQANIFTHQFHDVSVGLFFDPNRNMVPPNLVQACFQQVCFLF